MESYSLHQLNEYIRRVIALNFREPLWIEAEVVQVRESRGNWYLELVEKKEGSDDVIAQASAAIWYRNFQFIKKKLGDVINDLLQDGTQVRIKCTVDFHERYGLKLLIQDIDPKFTFGQLEMDRQRVIERLQKEGLMELNRSLILPPVLQSVAVISSSKAAGFKDFTAQLKNNIHGYSFRLELFETAVQGKKLESETVGAINRIKDCKDRFDVIVIIRGGGSRLDLSGYDAFGVAEAIATSGLPVLTGIGHEVDQSVADMVSNLSLKTPTAVADFLVEHHLLFESKMEELANRVFENARATIQEKQLILQSFSEQIRLLGKAPLELSGLKLQQLEERMHNGVRHTLEGLTRQLEQMTLQVESSDPKTILNKGYAYITYDNKTIRTVGQLNQDQIVELHLADGNRQSKII